ncbi:MAG: transcriptional regulator [Chloroflexota bacterium]|nr:transcriptional regulator [Chloroflexota bacterium]
MTSRQTDPGGGIASRIREARRDAGLTQEELAALVGVTAHTVWCWEAGRRKPGQERLAAIDFHCETARAGKPARAAAAGRKRSSPVRVAVSREERMRAVLGVIARYAARHGYPPSMREIQIETGFSSLSVVGYSLKACEAAGLIVRARGSARAVALTEAGRAFAEALSETGSLPVRHEEVAPSPPRTAVVPDDETETPTPPVLRLPTDRSRPVERR